jgi:amidase
MARTVKDAAYLLTAIVGYDKGDNYTAGIPWTVVPDYVGACKLTGLQGIKIGYVCFNVKD